ncbi:uncharacterized protein IL334_005241 [Kwoniella shivajii]|uniref:Uncharacterized protein n=1 Tax=Kwoniella shivajii TaxID=564305 RepID=A0ABZ1D2Y8_9TREE|nr:hypothetical protein IL334_005241 [Kwoniella shivajii]
MSAEVEAPRAMSSFPRPTSLYVPDIPRSVPILDTTSYSPFPTFPGTTRNRDPYGLNAFLLHPDDTLWHYVDPMPDDNGSNGIPIAQRSTSMEGETSSPPSRTKSVRKQRSLSMIRKPSPLSQPPVSGGEEDMLNVNPVTLQRRRSSSLSSSPRLSVEQAEAVIAIFREEISYSKTPKTGKKSLKRVFTKARKSVFGINDSAAPPPVPALHESPMLLAPASSAPLTDSVDPSTPMTSRSNSNYSTLSSASSTSSSEGVKTPGENVSLDVALTGSKLVNALQEAGEKDKKNKGKNWRGWLGGKKNGKLSAKDSDESGSVTPLSDLSAGSTPNSSTPDLLSTAIPKVTLTPSPAITTPPRGLTPVLTPSDQFARQHSWASEQLRRVSMRKLSQLRSPSPHPLALSLRRQNSRLPDEVAFSIRSDQRVFPMSVNSHQGCGGDLLPAQGGLWLNLAISNVMQKLDQGQQPVGILKTRRNSKKSIVPRPRGVYDFINRAPFEERNIVFYPDNVFSPISMARPGYGVWDLDFSSYILGLAEMYEPSTSSWPAFPRTSMENPSLPAEFIDAMKSLENKSNEESLEALNSPDYREITQDASAALKTLTANSPSTSSTPSVSPTGSPKRERPLSSFRPAGRHSRVRDEDEASSEESEDESDEDDRPLAVVAKRRSQSFQSQYHGTTSDQLRPAHIHARSLSQPANKRSSKRLSMTIEAEIKWRENQNQTAMDTVARARELRAQNAAGHMERQADKEKIKQQEASRRSSMMDLRDHQLVATSSSSPKHKRNSSASMGPERPSSVHIAAAFPTAPHQDSRRRVQSHARPNHLSPIRPENTRAKSGPARLTGEKRRYHSFYEQKASSLSTLSFNESSRSAPHPNSQHQHQNQPHQHFVHQHQQMVLPPHHNLPMPMQMQMQMQGFPQFQNQHPRGSMYGMNVYPQMHMLAANQGQGQLRFPTMNGQNRTRMA